MKRIWIPGYGVTILQKFDLEDNEVMLKEERLEKRYDHRISANAYFGPTKNARLSAVMLNIEGGEAVVVNFARVLVLIQLRSGMWVEEWEVAFLKYIETTSTLNEVEKNLRFIRVRPPASVERTTVFVVKILGLVL